MNDIHDLVRNAARRLGLTLFLDRLQWVAAGLAALALIVVIATKGIPAVDAVIGWAWLAPILGVLTLVTTGLWAWSRQPAPLHVAIAVDERLDLREKLSTAMVVRDRDDAFAQAAIDDAIKVAQSPQTHERVRRAFSVRAPRRWWLAPLLLAAAILTGATVPNGDWFAREENKLAAIDREEIQRIQAEVEEAIEKVAEETGKTKEEIKDLIREEENANIQKEEPRSAEDAKRDAFKKMSALQEQLKKESQGEKAQQLAALNDKLSQLRSSEKGPAGELAKALAKGDFAQAQKALDQLKKDMEAGKLPPEQREALEKLAQQLNQLAKNNQALKNQLKKAGMDPNLANDPQALQKALQNAQNLTPQQKQQLQQMAQATAQANQMCKGMGQAAQNMAAGQMGGAQSMGGQLSQMEMMQQQMDGLDAAMKDLGGMCNKMGEGMGNFQGQNAGIGQNAAAQMWMQQQMMGGRGPGMKAQGIGAGGYGTRNAVKVNMEDLKANTNLDPNAPIIGQMQIEAQQLITGESSALLDHVIETARSRATEDVENNDIEVQYRAAVTHYFGEFETTIKKIAEEAANKEASSSEAEDDDQ